jgi:hypothetical protein
MWALELLDGNSAVFVLCGMFVRYGLLTAYRQLRRIIGTPEDAFGASSESFRKISTAIAAAGASRKGVS